MILLAKTLVAKLASIGPVLFMHCLNVLLQVVLPLEPVRADGADVGLSAIRFFVDWRLVRLHDVSSKMVSLQEALVTQVTSKRLYLKRKK